MGHADGRAQSPKRSDTSLETSPRTEVSEQCGHMSRLSLAPSKWSVFLKHEKGRNNRFMLKRDKDKWGSMTACL